MRDLVLTPSGRLALFESGDAEGPGLPESQGGTLKEAFEKGPADGLLHLATIRHDAPLTPVLSYWRSFGERYLAELCRVPEPSENLNAPLPPPLEDLAEMAAAAPPMRGGEYLRAGTLERLWSEMDARARAGIAACAGGLSEWLRARSPLWHRVGRVCFHLAENSATVERWYQELLDLKARERQDASCPRVLGIDEHFFTRKDGYATTFCDLGKRRVFDVALGHSERALEGYLGQLLGKKEVRVVCMDLSSAYRNIARHHFPKALIVADRIHVIRLVNHHFVAAWALIDPKGRANRGLLSLVRRHEERLRPDQRRRLLEYWTRFPAFHVIYDFKQRLCRLLRIKHRTKRHCRRLVPHLLSAISSLKSSGLSHLVQLGETMDSWKEEIARMWRFTKSNGITEGFHTKMEMISRRAFGFRNFENYRLRVKVLCG